MAIKEEFLQLHQFLKDEEDIRLRQLKQEEAIKIQVLCDKIEIIEDEIKALNSTISKIDIVLRRKDLPFLQVRSNVYGFISRVKCSRLILNQSLSQQLHILYIKIPSLIRKYKFYILAK